MKNNQLYQVRYFEVKSHNAFIEATIKLLSVGKIRYSEIKNDYLWLYHFEINDEWKDYFVLAKGTIDKDTSLLNLKGVDDKPIFVRIDSGCMTGMIFGDRTCECKEQLEMAISELKKKDFGFIIHIPKQDGRGMGIDFKLNTLTIQDETNQDNISVSRQLAGISNIDKRNYYGSVAILKYFEINNVNIDIATNNPQKIAIFEDNGYKILNRTPMIIKPSTLTDKHLNAKKEKLGHLL